jgi:ABC-2 type transport system ATP-binding protein
MNDPIIQLAQVSKKYGQTNALDNLNLNIAKGELFGLVGVNGAGKTTTLSVMMGFIRASSGSAKIFGLDAWQQAHRLHRRIAWLPGDVRLPDGVSAKHWLEYQFVAAGLSLSRLNELARVWEVPLEKPMQTLSKGNRQKVALMRLLASEAEIFILDEPTSGLDPVGQERLLSALRQRANSGATVLFSSHSLAEVHTLCDQIAVIDQGRVLQTGSVVALTGGTQTLRVWSKDPLDTSLFSAWQSQFVTPTHLILEGKNLLEAALPRLIPFQVERIEFGGMGLEQLLERSHGTEVHT